MGQMRTVGKTATSVRRDEDGTLTVRYHATDVVTALPDGTIRLATNGYKTVTTKARMNQASNQYDLGYCVYQKDYAWYVDYKGETHDFNEDAITLN